MSNTTTTENNFEHNCRTALDKIISIQKSHTENGNILKKVINKINGFIATKGVILDNYDNECPESEKKKILAKFLDDVKNLKY